MQSWLFWDFKDFGKNWGSNVDLFTDNLSSGMFNPDGTPKMQVLTVLSRTYMQRTAGNLLKSSYKH